MPGRLFPPPDRWSRASLPDHRDAALEQALDLFSDVILNPSFPDRELQRLKLGRLDLLEERSHSPEQIAYDVLPRLLYHPQHPYARAQLGTLESVRSITRQDVVEYYNRNFVPGNAARSSWAMCGRTQ